MKTKLLAMLLLAGGSMFAQTRFSAGLGFGGSSAGFTPPAYVSAIPPCPGPDYTSRQGFARGFRDDRSRGSELSRNLSGQDRNQTREFTAGQISGFGHQPNQNQNRGFSTQDQGGNRTHSDGQDNRQGNGSANGFRAR
jgi:hypothetical protein